MITALIQQFTLIHSAKECRSVNNPLNYNVNKKMFAINHLISFSDVFTFRHNFAQIVEPDGVYFRVFVSVCARTDMILELFQNKLCK